MKEWITGRNPVYETLRAARRQISRVRIAEGVVEQGPLESIRILARDKGIPIESVPRQTLETLDPNNQGVGLQVGQYPYAALHDILARAQTRREPPFLLLLDSLQDPQNLGTLFRTAEAVGVHGVILPYRRTATVTPAVVSASSGATEHLLIAQANLAQTIRELKQENIWVIGLEGDGEAQTPDGMRLDGALALVVGNEGSGLRRLVRESCDLLMRLPMRGEVASLNAAVAGSIALYLVRQTRGFGR